MTGPVVSVASPGELLAAVPHLLGFVPRQSLVVIGLRPPRGRVRLTARIDLPSPGDEAAVVRAVLPALVRGRCTGTVAVVYLDDDTVLAPVGGSLPQAGLVTHLAQSLTRDGIGLRDAVCVSGGRFRSYLCRDFTCCAPGGRPVPPVDGSVLAAHTVVSGRRVWASREELAASIRPGPTAERAAVRRAVDAAVDRLVSRLADGASVTALRRETLQTWARTLARVGAGHGVDEADEVDGVGGADTLAALLIGLSDVTTRDAVIAASFDDDPARALPLLERLTRCAPHPYVAPAAVLLAWHAYAAGDGALASVAVDRALAEDAEHSLARLVDQGLRQGLPPDVLREVTRSSRDQVWARLAGPDTAVS